MATYTQPSRNSIAVEALKLNGHPAGGTAGEIALVESAIEEAKMDIWNIQNHYKGKLKPLLVTAYGVATENVSRYAKPADCDALYSVSILDSDETGNATAVSASQVTCGSVTPGRMLLLTSGTGLGNCSQISSYTGGIAYLTPNFSGSSFDGTEGYMAIETSEELISKPPKWLDDIDDPYEKDQPTHYFEQGQGKADTDETGEFELYPTPDALYGLKIRYYMNIMLMDLSTDAALVGGIYRMFKPIFMKKAQITVQMINRKYDSIPTLEKQYWSMVDLFVKANIDEIAIPTPKDTRLYSGNYTYDITTNDIT